jgi:hypothetical protein
MLAKPIPNEMLALLINGAPRRLTNFEEGRA